MEFRVLGSLEIWDEGSQIEISGPKRRALLALLVLHVNEVVGKDRLVDELWGESAPRTAAASLHNHVSRLRKALGTETLGTHAWGYVLRADPHGIDLHEFERLARDAEPLPAKERAAKLREALGLWRGPALADLVFEPVLGKEAARLEELRLAIVEARIDADLERGCDVELVPELEALISEHPLRERLRGQLILALYRDGRQAEALEVYRETRRLLADELGLEPSRELRELERAILRQDPALMPAAASSAAPGDLPQMHRRWLVYAALVAAAVLAVGGIAAFAVVHATGSSGDSSALLPAQTEPAAPFSFARPRPHAAAKAHLAVHRPTGPVQVKARAQATHRSNAGTAPTGSAGVTTAKSASPAGTVHKPEHHGTVKKRRRVKPPPAFRIADDFAASTYNSQLWDWGSYGTGVEVAQRNGRLELTLHADATPDPRWNAMFGYYTTACSLTGDFDTRIDYTLVDWPAANGAVVGVDLTMPDNVLNIVRKSLASGEEAYAFSAPTGEYRELRTTDTRGGFRLTRVGSLITAYYRNGQHWAKFAWAHHTGALRMRPILWASGSDFAHHDVTVAFDDFVVEAPRAPCP